MKANSKESGSCVKIKNYDYAIFENSKSRFKSTDKNPIRIVIDKIGANGIIQQQIVNQNEQLYKQSRRLIQPKLGKTSPRTKRREPSLPNLHLSLNHNNNNEKQQLTSRSHVFNRFHYDNYHKLPKQQTKMTLNSRKKLSNPNHKNIQTVFCQNKFPQFVERTNQKIEQIYKKQQIQIHTQNQKFISTRVQKQKIPLRRQQKTTLASCLKQFTTLEKLSIFMQNDQNLREQFIRYGIQRDPSRTLLIDVLNHRFSFMKQVNRRLRDNIYRSLFKRDDIHPLTKISVQEYILFYQMFIGRDAGVVQTATFVYLLLFGTNPPSFETGKSIIEQTKGPIHKQKFASQTLNSFFEASQLQEVISSIANNEQFTRIIVDLIIQK